MKMRKLLVASLALAGAVTTTSCGNQNTTVLKIGLECNYAPFNWTENTENYYTLPIANKAGLYADGYDIQLAKYLSTALGQPVQIIQTEWDTLIPDLQTGSIDLVIAGMTDTEERRTSIDFTDEYYRSELVLVTKKEVADQYTTALTSEQLGALIANKALVSQKSTVTDDILDKFKTTYSSTHSPALNSFALAATDVSNGTAFAMTAELPVANAIVKSNTSLGIVHIDQSILGETQAELGVSIGLRKNSTELKDKINKALSKVTKEIRDQLMTEATARSGE